MWRMCTMAVTLGAAILAEPVGRRPYELDWAGRTEDDHAPLVDFEDMSGWRVETRNAEAHVEASREQQIWGRFVGKLTYRGAGGSPEVRIVPPAPIPIAAGFDAVTCWVYGNNIFGRDPSTPPVTIHADFMGAQGEAVRVTLATIRWQEWFLCHRRLNEEQADCVGGGGHFVGFTVTGGRNTEDRVLYLDNLAVFTERFVPLEFEPRPARGVTVFPDRQPGLNRGPGRLPFPNREETIAPLNATDNYRNSLRTEDDAFVFDYRGADGQLTVRIPHLSAQWDDIALLWTGRGDWVRPCVDGGIYVADGNGGLVRPEDWELVSARREAGTAVCVWQTTTGDPIRLFTTFRLIGKNLLMDVACRGGRVHEIRFWRAVGLKNPRLVTLPYYTYGMPVRPAVAVAGAADAPLFLACHVDWTLSNASTPWAENAIRDDGVLVNGGTRYIPRTDGVRNDCFERFVVTLTPFFDETLPTIPNPVSPWKAVTGTGVWRAHGAGNRDSDKTFWRRIHRLGMREIVVTDHETGWRDGEESFTFRTRAAPGKGGDEGQFDYARFMQDELGFTYGPYNNFTDFAPVNEFWSTDMVSRLPDNQLQTAWRRCYAPKPARAVEYCEKLAPIIESKFRFSTAYCDVHTAVTPWSRVDYDWRVPGAGTFAAVFYAFGEIMLLQKEAWGGPVYSEGNNHFMYCGLTDGNYAQDQRYRIPENPWLVDFDLRRMHDLCCNFGMGNLDMFYGRETSLGNTPAEVDAAVDRFLAGTVAFGHTGFLLRRGGESITLRSYYMLQALHARYAMGSAERIRYVAADGTLLDSSMAVARAVYRRSQVVTHYDNGCVTVVNGHPHERLQTTVDDRSIDLPPNGYAGWTTDGAVEVFSGEVDGIRGDIAVTPDYTYVDGRGQVVRFDAASGDGPGVCRRLDDQTWEVILLDGADCGFAVHADAAEALDEAGTVLGPAHLRRSRGLTYVIPVEGAFSYRLRRANGEAEAGLACSRVTAVPGEEVEVRGNAVHRLRIPTAAVPGQRLWLQAEGHWIDVTVAPLAQLALRSDGRHLSVGLISRLASPRKATAAFLDQMHEVMLTPGQETEIRADLGQPNHESFRWLDLAIEAGGLHLSERRLLVARRRRPNMVDMPSVAETGICLRDGEETTNPGTTRGRVGHRDIACGGISREALAMHPPYVSGVGYAYALLEPVTLPGNVPCAFRAQVGKGDGSDPGDGILYRLVVVEPAGRQSVLAEHHVTAHEWVPMEADLTAWAGQAVRLKLVSDVGPADDSSGDWACWADLAIVRRDPAIEWEILAAEDGAEMEPGPVPCTVGDVSELRSAVRGWLHYRGMGLEGTGGRYESYAVLNGVELGPMARASGRETDGGWSEQTHVPLTPAAIATLSWRNEFQLRNPGRDYFKVRGFWLELELPGGERCGSWICNGVRSQPPEWPYAEGVSLPFGHDITYQLWFAPR